MQTYSSIVGSSLPGAYAPRLVLAIQPRGANNEVAPGPKEEARMRRTSLVLLVALLAVPAVALPANRPAPPAEPEVNTFSIVAYDPKANEWGVAVASKYLAVGSVVPWARPGVGAVATQSYVNVGYGPRGLELLAQGKSAEEVVKALTEDDRGKESRQLAVVDAKGNVAS